VKKIDLTDQRFGLLTALYSNGKDSTGKTTWLCQCDCGNKKSITLLNLRSKNSKSCGCKKHLSGLDNPRTITDTNILKAKKRSFALRRHWRKAVLERDCNCQKCGTTEKLQAHHLLGVQDHPEEMLNVENGTTLCFRCHLDFHIKYGRKTGFTKENFYEFIAKERK
jgi:5-methylcytosine-specific restriction endonuclease McrA